MGSVSDLGAKADALLAQLAAAEQEALLQEELLEKERAEEDLRKQKAIDETKIEVDKGVSSPIDIASASTTKAVDPAQAHKAMPSGGAKRGHGKRRRGQINIPA